MSTDSTQHGIQKQQQRVILLRILQVLAFEIPFTNGFTFVNFLSDAGDVREWNLQGLPADAFSTENGVVVTRSNRWSLMIDPQVMACCSFVVVA